MPCRTSGCEPSEHEYNDHSETLKALTLQMAKITPEKQRVTKVKVPQEDTPPQELTNFCQKESGSGVGP